MKLFKHFSAMTIAVSAAAALSLNVSAGVVGFNYAPAGGNCANYEFTADDGTEGWLYFTVDDDGNIWFSSYDIGLRLPQDPNDVHNRMNFDGDYQEFTSSQDFFDYVDELEKENGETQYIRYAGLVAEFDRKFDPPSDGIISMSGGRCYVADFENDTVSYVGYYVVYEEAAAEYPESDTFYCECTAEDGTKFRLNYDYDCWGAVDTDVEPAPIDYVIDHANKKVSIPDIDTGYPPYDGGIVPTGDNEFAMSVEIDDVVKVSEQVTCYVKGERVYVIDKLNGKARYVGYTAEYKYIEYDNENNTVYFIGTTEDGANYSLALDKQENGGFVYSALMIDNIPPEYDITENSDSDNSSKAVSWRDDVFDVVFYYFDPADIDLSDNELLISISFDIDIGSEVISLYKHYIIVLDGENSTVRYYCMSFAEDNNGATTSPDTGNGGGYLNIMLAAAGTAILAKRAKK
ncbi:MAG: hypothetical protein K2N60_01825 [Oscillospiraceae bacterium]|nr:hypothetical protein [Oscillospiraceae bacterium]